MSISYRGIGRCAFGALFIFLCIASWANAQQVRMIKMGEGGAFLIPELGALVAIEDSQLVVIDRMPTDRMPREYQSVDIKQGDIVLMVDGKKMASPDQLQKYYDTLAVGREIKIGLKRGDNMFIASFKKADPSTLPQIKRMVMTPDGKGADGKGGMALSVDGDPIPILELGIIFAAKDGQIRVGKILPIPAAVPLKTKPKEGDLLVSLQGSTYTTASSLLKAWDAIPVGESVQIVLRGEGKDMKLAFFKPKPVNEVNLKTTK